MEDILISIFLQILNMSMTASYIILAVIIVRLLLRRAPKKYSYALWAVALFRLVCPVSFKSVISIFALKPFAIKMEDSILSSQGSEIVHIPENISTMPQPEIQTGLPAVDAVVNQSLPAATPMVSANPMQYWEFFGMLLWIVGIAVLLIVSAVCLIKLRRRLSAATRLEGNVWQSEKVGSPFVVGLIRPKIYIPYGLAEPALGYVLAHERAHIKRGDHILRTLAYAVLCLHWFNPLVWLAFYFMGRDMELSCDEKVLERMGDKAEYSETLLSFASPRRFPTPTPLAFGESSVATRIKNALKWRRPRLWVSIIALVLCIAVIAACAANPKAEDDGWELAGRWVPVECVYQSPVYSYFPFGGDNGYVYDIHEHGDGLNILDRQSGEWRGGYSVFNGWKWQDFPYSDSEWSEMCSRYQYSLGGSLSELYDEILYMPLIGNTTGEPIVESHAEVNCFLLSVDGELWFVSTTKDTNGKRWISSIYTLQKEAELGEASFIYPDGTSNEPGIEISFADSFEAINVFTSGGLLSAYKDGVRCTGVDASIVVPEGGSLFWSPVQNDAERPEAYNLSQSAVIRLTVDYGGSTRMCSIYVSFDDGTYTLRPVGKGVHLGQTGDGKALLSFSGAEAYPKASASDIPAGSPWALLAGLSFDDISGIIVDGSASAVYNAQPLDILKPQVVEALKHVSAHEVYVGRGAPYRYCVGLGINGGESQISLGYCGDFVELHLMGPVADVYPAEGGVWEIHNTALTELLGSIESMEVLNFEARLSPDRSFDGHIELSFDIPGVDKVEIYNHLRSFPDEKGGTHAHSTFGEIPVGTSALWLPWTDTNGNGHGDLLAESGGLMFTVWMNGKYAQGQISIEGDKLRTTADGQQAEYRAVLEGPFEASVGEKEKEITLSIDDSYMKPTPYQYIKRLMPSDVRGFELNGQLDDRILDAGLRDIELVELLGGIEADELQLSMSSITGVRCEAVLRTDYTTMTLRYGEGAVELSFPPGVYDSIMGVWRIENDELNAFFEEILIGYEEEYGILSGKAEDVKSIYIQKPEWQTDGVRLFLDEESMEQFLKLLFSGEKRVEPYPSHLMSMQASTAYTITITYENGGGDLIYAADQSTGLHRYTGTYGSSNDPGYVLVISQEARALLEDIMGGEVLHVAYDGELPPEIGLDFGGYDSLDISCKGGHMLYSADGEGWGDFIGSISLKEKMELLWSPMEPVNGENVLARRVESTLISFTMNFDGETYRGAIAIADDKGQYKLSLYGDGLSLEQGQNSTARIVPEK